MSRRAIIGVWVALFGRYLEGPWAVRLRTEEKRQCSG
jgi:hypothetical protein